MESKIIQKDNVTYCQLIDDWMSVTILTWGARLVSIEMPDKYGHKDNIVVGYDYLEQFKDDTYCFGATVGPVAGRIANGQWNQYQMETNEGKNTLHSGSSGWQNRDFIIVSHQSYPEFAEVTLSPKEESVGIPEGHNEITYRLTNNHDLEIIYKTTASETTLWNPTNHAYFNLSGRPQSIRNHELYLNSHQRLALNSEGLPTGEVIDTAHTAYDFSSLTLLESLPQEGLDDCFILEKDSQNKGALILQHLESGRKIKITTMRDSIILFTGTGMTDSEITIHGQPLISEEGLAIECQECPDAINHQHSCIVVNEGETKLKMTTYHFSVIK